MKHKIAKRFFVIFGIVFLIAAVTLVSAVYLINKKNETAKKEVLSAAMDLIPHGEYGFVDSENDKPLSVLEINHQDCCGILRYETGSLDIPIFPHYSDSYVSLQPAVYSGTPYQGNFIIGGNDKIGSFSFAQKCEKGDSFRFTDVKGSVFLYKITKISHKTKINQEILNDKEDDMVLFCRSSFGKYTVIHCSVSQ